MGPGAGGRRRHVAHTFSDVLRAVDREETTAENFLETYNGYRQALLAFQRLTHYDFRTGQPVFQQFGIE